MTSGKAATVRDMFAAIAPSYDRTNRAMSVGLDESWRRRAIALLDPAPGGRILDLCTGTGDLAFALQRRDPSLRVTGLDFCEPMLGEARRRAAKGDAGVEFVTGDVLALPFGDNEFDGAIMGFSMRNIIDIAASLREVRRVLRPGARFVNLDMSHPPSPLGHWAFTRYFNIAVPFIGALMSKSPGAYRYLPSSLVNYPGAERLRDMFAKSGFVQPRYTRLLFGAVAIHVGTK